MVRIPMTRAEFDEKAHELNGRGFTVAGDTGVLEKDGVKVKYTFDGTLLVCEVVDKPFVFSTGLVEGQLRDWLGDA